jgi:hypothetical protein
VLEELSPTLRSTNFSCVFVDPGQVAQRHIILAQRWVRSPRDSIPGDVGRKQWALPEQPPR